MATASAEGGEAMARLLVAVAQPGAGQASNSTTSAPLARPRSRDMSASRPSSMLSPTLPLSSSALSSRRPSAASSLWWCIQARIPTPGTTLPTSTMSPRRSGGRWTMRGSFASHGKRCRTQRHTCSSTGSQATRSRQGSRTLWTPRRRGPGESWTRSAVGKRLRRLWQPRWRGWRRRPGRLRLQQPPRLRLMPSQGWLTGRAMKMRAPLAAPLSVKVRLMRLPRSLGSGPALLLQAGRSGPVPPRPSPLSTSPSSRESRNLLLTMSPSPLSFSDLSRRSITA
mmetsp:Transcript_57434/g.121875  ORF Transcript_57434/g.121875 Transcript_57434/m.121875 type:complete len:282 (+) Transcript_57434:1531-2376(+)